jgi:hypothetical protein
VIKFFHPDLKTGPLGSFTSQPCETPCVARLWHETGCFCAGARDSILRDSYGGRFATTTIRVQVFVIMRLAKSTVPQAQRQVADRIQSMVAPLALLGLALAGGCTAISTLPVASVIGSPNAAALEIHNSTEVRLQDANFIVTKANLVGQSKGFALLGIVTIVPPETRPAFSDQPTATLKDHGEICKTDPQIPFVRNQSHYPQTQQVAVGLKVCYYASNHGLYHNRRFSMRCHERPRAGNRR